MNTIHTSFNDLLIDARLNELQAINMLEISKRTLTRYKNGTTKPPSYLIKFLKVLAGDISIIDNHFKNWFLKRGELINPANETFDIKRLNYVSGIFGQLQAIRQNKAELLTKIRLLETENNLLRSKNKPANIPINDPIYRKLSL